MKRVILSSFVILLAIFSNARDMVITKLNQSPIRIGNKSLKVGDTFSDTDVISWSSIKQDMKAKPKSGGLPRHYSAAAFKSKSQHSISIQQYLKYLNKTNRPSTLDVGDMYLQKSENSDKYPEKRIALVIGNSIYGLLGRDLDCPISDAEDVTATLNELGFDTYTLYDAPNEDFHSALMKFSNVASAGEYDVALFYFCGHGSQNDGKNYLLPCDAKNDTPEDLSTWISFDAVFESLSETGCITKLAFLDACRNAPRWQAHEKASRLDQYDTMGSLVVYSTANNMEAIGEQEEESRNTPFGAAFLESVLKPSENVSLTIKSISESVRQRTDYFTQYGVPPQQVYTFGIGDVDFSFVKGANIEALIEKSKYFLSNDNPEMAIVYLDQLKANYLYLDTIQKCDYYSLVLGVNDKIQQSRVSLFAIKDTASLNKFDLISVLNNFHSLGEIYYKDEYDNYKRAYVLENPNHGIDTISLEKRIVTNNNYFAFVASVPLEDIDPKQWIFYDPNLNDGEISYKDNSYSGKIGLTDIEGIFICSGIDGVIQSATEVFSWSLSSTYPVALNKDGTKLIYKETGNSYEELCLADFKTHTKKKILKYYSNESLGYCECGFSENDNFFYLLQDNRITVYNSETLDEIHSFTYENCDTVFWLDCNLVIKNDNQLFYWQIKDEKSQISIELKNSLVDVAISDDKKYFAAICDNGDLHIVNTESLNRIIFCDFIEHPSSIEFTHDNQSLWVSSMSFEIKEIDVYSGETYIIKDTPPDACLYRQTYMYFFTDTALCFSRYFQGTMFEIFDVNNRKAVNCNTELLSKLFHENVNDKNIVDFIYEKSHELFSYNDNWKRYDYSLIDESVEAGLIVKKTTIDKSTIILGYYDGRIKIISGPKRNDFLELMIKNDTIRLADADLEIGIKRYIEFLKYKEEDPIFSSDYIIVPNIEVKVSLLKKKYKKGKWRTKYDACSLIEYVENQYELNEIDNFYVWLFEDENLGKYKNDVYTLLPKNYQNSFLRFLNNFYDE